MKTAWMQSAGHLFLIERYDDGSYGVVLEDQFLGFVVRADGSYVAIAAGEGAVVGDARSLGAAATLLANDSLLVGRAAVAQAA
jgi:phosphoribosylformylglycinamidine (FGAM) synthase-like enzyme